MAALPVFTTVSPAAFAVFPTVPTASAAVFTVPAAALAAVFPIFLAVDLTVLAASDPVFLATAEVWDPPFFGAEVVDEAQGLEQVLLAHSVFLALGLEQEDLAQFPFWAQAANERTMTATDVERSIFFMYGCVWIGSLHLPKFTNACQRRIRLSLARYF